ncbi:MAG: ribonuclease Y [Candidatus Latescibacteria bacterium]|nr:ribonuclease Y [Candidatus Latescibacterota bacterium]
MPDITTIVIVFVSLVAGLGFFILGWIAANKVNHAKMRSAEAYARKITEDAEREAENIKKAAILDAKDEWYRERSKFEKDTRDARQDIEKLQQELHDRERKLDKKVDILNAKERNILIKERENAAKDKALRVKTDQLSQLINTQNEKLERISGMTSDEAKEQLLANLEKEARVHAAKIQKDIRDKAIREADRESKEIIISAIQRCAAEHTVESSVSVVPLPNDEMKGRIIGREGRNIRSFETATGVDVIVDDTPEAVILCGFDRVRREVARRALERLVTDGRIHPSRIEEVVEKAQAEVEASFIELGENAAMEAKVHNLHPKLIEHLGRLHYRTSYGQNVLQHAVEVSIFAGLMAAELGLDVQLSRRAGLLHDIGKALDHDMEGTHTEIGLMLARKYNENEVVLDAIASLHEDQEARYITSAIVQAADTISCARPGARREDLESYIKRLERLEELADSFDGVEKTYAIQAGREIRVMVNTELIDDAQADQLAYDISEKIEKDLDYPGQIKVTVIREMRAVQYAR